MSFRRVLTVFAFLLLAFVFAGQVRALLADPTIWPPDDFVEYWAAARLTLEGGNPFDPSQLLPLEQLAGRKTDEAVMMWNPPWALTVVLPLGLLPAREAQLLWFAVNLMAMGVCGDRLWLLLGGSRARRWVGLSVALVALPTAFALQSGQVSPLLLLGAVLFLELQKRNLQYWAGAATVLLAAKPHLAYLVWAAILVEAHIRGRWKVVIGGALTGVVCTLIPLAFDRQLLHQYADALGNRPPEQWVSPTIGTVLRLVFGAEMFRLQFIPVAVGFLWFVWHIRNCLDRKEFDRSWNWQKQLPLLLLVSFVTAPYGAWPFDNVLLLPAVVDVIIRSRGRPRRVAIGGLVAINLGCLILNLLAVPSFWFLWVSPSVLVVYSFALPRPTKGQPQAYQVEESRALVSA
jgi:hypothetical protein